MRSAALQEYLSQPFAQKPFPILDVAWQSRMKVLTPGLYAPRPMRTAAGAMTGLVVPGGWEQIKYGSGIESSKLETASTTVSVLDETGALIKSLDTYRPRGSAARIRCGVESLLPADWETIFTGIVADWAYDEPVTKLLLKTDDTALRRPVPRAVVQRTEWSGAQDPTIFNTLMPLVTGVHDSWQITSRGMIQCVNVSYDATRGYWWLVSVDQMVDVIRVYFDGEEQADTGHWTIRRLVHGGNRVTLLVFDEGYQPPQGVLVSVDCYGPDEDGLSVGGPLTGVPDTLRMIIQEYGYREPPLSGWRGDHTICDDASWDAASVWFARHRMEAARRLGGDQNVESVAQVIDSFLFAYPYVRMWWNELGKIAICVLDPDDTDPDAAFQLDLKTHSAGGRVPFFPGDAREVYTHVTTPYMYSAADGKFLTAYTACDLDALGGEKSELVIENIWSQCRYTQDGPALNPAP